MQKIAPGIERDIAEIDARQRQFTTHEPSREPRIVGHLWMIDERCLCGSSTLDMLELDDKRVFVCTVCGAPWRR